MRSPIIIKLALFTPLENCNCRRKYCVAIAFFLFAAWTAIEYGIPSSDTCTVAILAQGTLSGWSVSLAFFVLGSNPNPVTFQKMSRICGPNSGLSTVRPARRKTQIRGTDEERKVVSCSSNCCCGELLSMDSSFLRLIIGVCVMVGCWYSVWGSVLLVNVERVKLSNQIYCLRRFGDS